MSAPNTLESRTPNVKIRCTSKIDSIHCSLGWKRVKKGRFWVMFHYRHSVTVTKGIILEMATQRTCARI
jgi:hypothetical protein